MAPTLGYWNIRGLSQHLRFVLEYTGETYEEKRYECGPAPDFDRSSWTSVKHTLGLPLPNLPYYIDGDIKLTQSNSILRHLGRKHNLYGQTEKEIMMIDMLVDQAMDIHMQYGILCYMNYTPEARKDYLEKLPESLKLLSNVLGSQKWFTGDKISIADFALYEKMSILLAFEGTCLDGFQNLKDFQKRFEDLPAIKKYMGSSKFIRNPINMPMAKHQPISK